MISCRFFDDFFTDCLMILRCFRCVFFKNVLLAAAASTFSFLDTQTFLCLFLAFSIPRGEVGENVCRQRWLGACPCRLGWERVASVAVPLSFLCSLKCCLLKNVLLAAAGSGNQSPAIAPERRPGGFPKIAKNHVKRTIFSVFGGG